MTIRNVRLTEAQIEALLSAANKEMEDLLGQGFYGNAVQNEINVLSRAQDALQSARPKRRT